MDLPQKQLDPQGPIASQGGSIPVFLRKAIATYDFTWGILPPPPPPPPLWIHSCRSWYRVYWQLFGPEHKFVAGYTND